MYNIILTRPFYKKRMGGVTTYVRQLLCNLNRELFNVVDSTPNIIEKWAQLHELSSTTPFENIIISIRVILHLLTFPYRLKKYNVHIVHANPSFAFIPLIRDGLFVMISSLCKKKCVVFIHGWREDHEKRIARSRLQSFLLKKCYNKSTLFVLSRKFKTKLLNMGINTTILTETTMVNDNLIPRCDVQRKLGNEDNKKKITFLFLSRILRTKGIYETVDSVIILNKKYHNIELIIAGTGEDLVHLKHYVNKNGVPNVRFLGYVRGDDKRKAFLSSDVYIFPTHREGMPITILEAMAFGLPVVTRPVGGIEDFFENGKHGFITESKSPEVFASLLETLIVNERLRHEMAVFNYKYAQERFMASKVTKRIEAVYLDIMKS